MIGVCTKCGKRIWIFSDSSTEGQWRHVDASIRHMANAGAKQTSTIEANRGEPRWQEWRVTFVLRTDLRVAEPKRPTSDAVEEFVTRAIDDANDTYSGEGEIDAIGFAVEKLGTVAG